MVISQNSGKEKIQAMVAFIRRNAGLDLGVGGEPGCSAGRFSHRAAKMSTIFLHIELGKNKPQTVTLVSEPLNWRGESCCLPSRPLFSQHLEDTQARGWCCWGSKGQGDGRVLMRRVCDECWAGVSAGVARGAVETAHLSAVSLLVLSPEPELKQVRESVCTVALMTVGSLRTRDCPPPRRGWWGEC